MTTEQGKKKGGEEEISFRKQALLVCGNRFQDLGSCDKSGMSGNMSIIDEQGGGGYTVLKSTSI